MARIFSNKVDWRTSVNLGSSGPLDGRPASATIDSPDAEQNDAPTANVNSPNVESGQDPTATVQSPNPVSNEAPTANVMSPGIASGAREPFAKIVDITVKPNVPV